MGSTKTWCRCTCAVLQMRVKADAKDKRGSRNGVGNWFCVHTISASSTEYCAAASMPNLPVVHSKHIIVGNSSAHVLSLSLLKRSRRALAVAYNVPTQCNVRASLAVRYTVLFPRNACHRPRPEYPVKDIGSFCLACRSVPESPRSSLTRECIRKINSTTHQESRTVSCHAHTCAARHDFAPSLY